MGRLWRWLRMQMSGGQRPLKPSRAHHNAIDVYMTIRKDDIDDLSRRVAVYEERLEIEQEIDQRQRNGENDGET